jgi:cobalt/nickel transport system permease protein
MITVIALLSTSEIKNLLQALNYFKLPKKLILLAFFFYRYIFVLKKELTKLLRAQKLGDFRINQLSKLTQAMVI